MKVFQLNEYEWWAGEDLESVIAFAMSEEMLSRDDLVDESIVHELTDEELQRYKVADEDSGNVFTFAEEISQLVAAGAEFPLLFAGQEF